MVLTDRTVLLQVESPGHKIKQWLGSLVVRLSDLRLNGRDFDSRSLHYRSVGILGCVTVFGRSYHLNMQPAIHTNSAPTLCGTGNKYRPVR